MSKFLDVLDVTEISDSVFAVANHPFRYLSDLEGLITIPVGFYTDYASVPRFLPLVYAMLGNTAHQPAVVHDFLYATALTTKAIADQVLLEAMEVIGMPWWRRWPIYLGVKVGGFVSWNQHRKEGDLVVPDTNIILHNHPAQDRPAA